MDIRQPGGGQALSRKRSGDSQGQEEDGDREAMLGGTARRRRAWWRGDDEDDWDGDPMLEDLLPRYTDLRGRVDEDDANIGAGVPAPQRPHTGRVGNQTMQQQQQQQQQQPSQPNPRRYPPFQLQQEAPVRSPPLILPRSMPPRPQNWLMLTSQELDRPQPRQPTAMVPQLLQLPQLGRHDPGPARAGHARRLSALPPSRRFASDSIAQGVGAGPDIDADFGDSDEDHHRYGTLGTGTTHVGASAGLTGRRNLGVDLSTTESKLEDSQLVMLLQEDLEEQQRADERRRQGDKAAAAQAAAGAVADLADAVPADSVTAVMESCDLLKEILKGLGVVELCRVARVSRLWRAVVDDPSFWRSVCVVGRRVTSEQILRLCRRQRGVIEELRLSGCSQLPGEAPFMQRLLANLSGLRVLELRSAHLSVRAFAQLSTGVPSLRELVLGDVQLMSNSGGTIGAVDAALSHPNLTYLELNHFKAGRLSLSCPHLARLSVASSQLAALVASGASLPAIRHLHLASTSRISDQSLFTAVNSLTSLHSLTVVESAVSEEQLRGIARSLTNLTQLELLDCSGVGLSPIRGAAPFPALRRLAVVHCDSLTSTSAVPLLEGCVSLEELALDGCSGLASLSLGLPLLRSVSLRGCRLLASVELRCRRLEELSLGALEPGGPGGAVLKRILVASESLRSLSLRRLPSLEDLTLDCAALAHLSLTDCDSLGDGIFSMLTDVQEVTLAPQTQPSAPNAVSLAPAPTPAASAAAVAAFTAVVDEMSSEAMGAVAGPAPRVRPEAGGAALAAAVPPAPAPRTEATAAAVGRTTCGVGQLGAGDAAADPIAGAAARQNDGAAGSGAGGLGDAAADATGHTGALSPPTEAAWATAGLRSVTPGPQIARRTKATRPLPLPAVGSAQRPTLLADFQPQRPTQALAPSARLPPEQRQFGFAPMPDGGVDPDGDDDMDGCGWQFHVEDLLMSEEPPTRALQPQVLSRVRQLRRRSPSAAMERRRLGPEVVAACNSAGSDTGPGQASGQSSAAAGVPAGTAARRTWWRRRSCDADYRKRRVGMLGPEIGNASGDDEDEGEDDNAGLSPADIGPAVSMGLLPMRVYEYDELEIVDGRPQNQRRGAATPACAGDGNPVHSAAAVREAPLQRVDAQTADRPAAAPAAPLRLSPEELQEVQEQELCFAGPQVLQPHSQPTAPALAPHPPQEPNNTGPQIQPRQQQGMQPQVVVHPKVGGCPRLQDLWLEGCEGLRHAQLRHTRLERLSLRGCRRLLSLRLSCPVLVELVLEECGELGAVALTPAGLERLSLGACCALREAELVCPSLEQLSLKGCGDLRRVSLMCPRMRELDATFCGELTDEALVSALACRPPLTSLVLSVCASLGAAVPAAVAPISELRHLDLSYSSVSQLGPLLTGCTALTSLCLGSCPELRGEDLLALLPGKGYALPHLASLDLSYCPLSYDVVGPLVRDLTYLTHLALNGCPGVDDRLWRHSPPLPSWLWSTVAPVAEESSPAPPPQEQPQAADAAPGPSVSGATVSRLSKLSLVRCCSLKSLCLGLLPREEQATEAMAAAGCHGGDGNSGSGGCAFQAHNATAAAVSRRAVVVVSPAGSLSPFQWQGSVALMLGPPWQSVACMLSGLVSLRLGLSSVQTVALALPHLTHLDLNGCSGLRCLELRCPSLAELHLQACSALPADLLVPLLVALGGAGGGRGLALLDAQHSGPFEEALASAVSAVAIMAAAANAEAGSGGDACCSRGAANQLMEGVAIGEDLKAVQDHPCDAEAAAASRGCGDGRQGVSAKGGDAGHSSVDGNFAAAGGGVDAQPSQSLSLSSPSSLVRPSYEDLLAARDTAWWLLPREGTVLTCGPDCTICRRRYRRATLGLSG